MRDRIQMYRWIGGNHPRNTGEKAKEAVAQGYHAVKMNGTDELKQSEGIHYNTGYDLLDYLNNPEVFHRTRKESKLNSIGGN